MKKTCKNRERRPKGAKRIYLLERIKDGNAYSKGERIWALQPCAGWRIVDKNWQGV